MLNETTFGVGRVIGIHFLFTSCWRKHPLAVYGNFHLGILSRWQWVLGKDHVARLCLDHSCYLVTVYEIYNLC